MATPPTIADTGDHEADVAAIGAIVADVQTGMNTRDAEPMIAHFAENASVVNAMGVAIAGRPALIQAHREGVTRFASDEHTRYDVTEVRFLRLDVALASVEARAMRPDGTLIDVDPVMRVLYVMVREQGRWWIAARHHSLVAKLDE